MWRSIFLILFLVGFFLLANYRVAQMEKPTPEIGGDIIRGCVTLYEGTALTCDGRSSARVAR